MSIISPLAWAVLEKKEVLNRERERARAHVETAIIHVISSVLLLLLRSLQFEHTLCPLAICA